MIGLFDLQSGTISFLGKDITEFPVNNLRIHIAYMQQETMLFGGTLFDNLRIYCPDATVAQMWDVLKICRMYDTVKGWKFGLFTDLSKGEILSSGQKQRIAIARILLRKPDVVLLDEPTSSLDSQTSEEIIDDFRRIFKNKILILVTHNVKCAEKADRIYVMEKGSIVAQGNHNELMKSCDIYKKLFQDQVSLLI